MMILAGASKPLSITRHKTLRCTDGHTDSGNPLKLKDVELLVPIPLPSDQMATNAPKSMYFRSVGETENPVHVGVNVLTVRSAWMPLSVTNVPH